MRPIILASGFAAAAVLVLSPAEAQQPKKDTRPGYVIIRVLLDDGARVAADPNNPMAQAPAVDPTRSVAAVIPYTSIENKLFDKNKTPNRYTNPSWPAFRHKLGDCFAYTDKTFIQYFVINHLHYEKDLRDAYEKWSQKQGYDNIHELVNKALMLGLVDEALKYAEAYYKLPENTGKPPLTDQYKNFAAAYKTIQEKLKAPLAANPDAETWKGRIGATGGINGNFYHLLTFDSNQPKEAKRRLDALDRNFKAFYLWHALQGMTPPIPAKKMVAVVAMASSDMGKYREGLDGLPIVSDAFYSPGNGLLVLAPERMDPNGNAFMNLTKARYQLGYNRDDLVKAVMPAVVPGKAAEIAQMQMLAVADAYVTEEADNAAISREASRQLMAASGMLPPNVQLPYWLEFGLGHFFQRAKGPVYVKNNTGIKMVVGLATGFGAPNFEQHRSFDTVKGDFKRNPAQTLANVLTGSYYAGAAAGQDVDPRAPVHNSATGGTGVGAPGGGTSPPPTTDDEGNASQANARLRQRLHWKADSSAWALVYYLQKTRAPGLQKFYAELSRMPRDLALEDETMLKVFCKAFGLSGVGGETDKEAFKTFSENWLKYMDNVQHFDYEVPLNQAELDPFGANNPATNPAGGVAPGPGAPGTPGSPPGGGPPGGGPPGGGPPGGRPGGG